MRTPRLLAVSRRRTARSEPPDPLRVGVISVAILLTVLVVTVFVDSLHLGKTTYRAEFAQAAGIAPGDAVNYVGIPIGTVTGTRLSGDHVTVTMKIDGDVTLGADTRASIKLTTLLGSRYVELRSSGVGRLTDGVIPLDQTEVPYNLETALQDATRTFGELDAEQIANSMTTLSTQLRDLPPLVPEVLRNVRSLSAVIAQRRQQIGTLVTSTAQVTGVIRDQQADLASLVSQGRTVLQEINSRQDALRRLLAATTTLVHQLEPIVVDDRGQVQALLNDLRSMTDMIARNDELMRSVLQILPVPWRLFANATGTGMELAAAAPDGAFVDSFMCALSKRAVEMGRAPYHKDCQ
ncbi:MCE family protein [Nocardia sp. NPDC005366]|uniref:MCE family protein n=1 Tax=Nocardia sp. NPDC005366 TaxID=3156878 RepID=UPI0033B00913